MTTLSATVPDEPPRRSVVIDQNQDAWQRLNGTADHDWWRVSSFYGNQMDNPPMQWPSLVVMRGPLLLVYSPPEPE